MNTTTKNKSVIKPKITIQMPPKRGQLLLLHRRLEKPLKQLKIYFDEKANIRIPYYSLENGKLVRIRTDSFKNMNEAIRRTHHQIDSIKNEKERMINVFRQLQGIHRKIFTEWKASSREKKALLSEEMFSLINFIGNEKLIEVEAKKHAIKRIYTAKELLEKDNFPAASAALVGTANDLIERINQLNSQLIFLDRRKKSIVSRKNKEKEKAEAVFEALIKTINAVEENKSFNEFSKEFNAFEKALKGLGKTRHSLLKQVQGIAFSIKENYLPSFSEKKKEILNALKKCSVNALTFLSDFDIVNERFFEFVKKQSPDTKKVVAFEQLNLFNENLEFWYSTARRKQKEHMVKWLKELSDLMPEKAKELTLKAANELENSRINEAMNLINQIMELI